MTDEQKQLIAEFRKHMAEQGIDISHLTDEQVAQKIHCIMTRYVTTVIKVFELVMMAISILLRLKAKQERIRRLCCRKKKSQQRNWRKWKRKKVSR